MYAVMACNQDARNNLRDVFRLEILPAITRSTGLTLKTAQKALLRLNQLGLVKRSRKIANSGTCRFNGENELNCHSDVVI